MPFDGLLICWYDKYGLNQRNYTRTINGVTTEWTYSTADNGACIYFAMLNEGNTISVRSKNVDNDRGMYLMAAELEIE